MAHMPPIDLRRDADRRIVAAVADIPAAQAAFNAAQARADDDRVRATFGETHEGYLADENQRAMQGAGY